MMGTRPRLSVCVVTWNSAATFAAWAASVRRYADELVVVVDAASTDDTLSIAQGVADRVVVVEHPRFVEEVLDYALRQATGDWILRLDDDEVMGCGFVEGAPRLLANRDVSYYYLERRWVARHDPHGQNGRSLAWVRQYPLFPDPSARLFRNVGGTYWHPTELHTSTVVLGAGMVADPDDAVIYHMDLVWRDRAQRERKVRDRYSIEGRDNCSEYYLFEERVGREALLPLDPGETDVIALAAFNRQTSPQGRDGVPPHEVVPLHRVLAEARAHSPAIACFGVRFLSDLTPDVMLPDHGYLVEVEVENTSDAAWCNYSVVGHREVRLSYHWQNEDGTIADFDGRRTILPRTIAPGESVRLLAGVWSPPAEGRYTLVWDLVQEGVTWFSERGAATLARPVEVRSKARQRSRLGFLRR